AALDQDNGADRKFVITRNQFTDTSDQELPIGLPAFRLGDDHQSLFTIAFDTEGYTMIAAQLRAVLLQRPLNILGIMIDPSYDDQIFQAAGNIQLSATHKTKITGAQKRTFIRITAQTSLKGRAAVFGFLPVSQGNAEASDPDFPHPIGRTDLPRIRI